ncbi:MAG TPA: nicotinamide riboside transporter PnuC [Candidatus Acidoferrum sp.]|nr:nicotinamide riboside transporter PnuC [Candidatus Acidoferrum sp.]
MQQQLQTILQAVLSLEGLAVALAIVYLLLAARESLWCWLCAFVSSAIYVWLCWESKLYMETWLNVFYAVMAVLGWWQWRQGSGGSDSRTITTLTTMQHLLFAAIVSVLSLGNGYYLQHNTDAAWPYVDSFITWSSVVVTFLVVRKVLENWLYWILIDGIAIVVYFDRERYLTALLFAGYVVIVVFGYFKWRREYQQAT